MTAIELTPKMRDLIEQVNAGEARAELDRRSKPKRQRPKASNEAARQLWAPTLRQIAKGNTVVTITPVSEAPVPDEVKAEIIHMPVIEVHPTETTTVEPATIAPIVSITSTKASRKPRPVTKRALALRTLTPITATTNQPDFTVPVVSLVEALKAIESPTKTRSGVLAILKSVVVQAEDDKVTLTTTDLDVTMQVQLPAKVGRAGAMAIPFAELKGVLPTAKKNQVGNAALVAGDDQVLVTMDSGSSTIRTQPVQDFPRLREINPEEGSTFELDLDAVASVLPAACKEDSRPILTGVLFDGNRVVATDSYRLAECESPTMTVEASMLVPATFLAGLVKRGKKAVALAGKFDLLVTDEDGMVMVSRLIEGEFPNYKSLFPAKTNERVTFQSDELIVALSGFLARKPQSTTAVRFGQSSNGKIPVRMVETDRFDATVEIAGSCPFEIGYNPRYLRDMVTGGFDQLDLVDALKPVVAERTDAGRRQRRLLMPVRLS